MQTGAASDIDVTVNTPDGPKPLTNGDTDGEHLQESLLPGDSHHDAKSPQSTRHASDASLSERGRKRKFAETLPPQRAKKLSPPWKKFGVDGVTTFTEGGRRKSGRTNTVPLDLQPPASKRTTRGEYGKHRGRKPSRGNVAQESAQDEGGLFSLNRSRRTSRAAHSVAESPSGSKLQSGHSIHTQPQSPTAQRASVARQGPRRSQPPQSTTTTARSSGRVGRPRRSQGLKVSSDQGLTSQSEDRNNLSALSAHRNDGRSRIRLRLGQQGLPTRNPAVVLPPKKYDSLEDFLARDDPLDGDDLGRYSMSQIHTEADARKRVIFAGRPGGSLAAAPQIDDEDGTQDEPSAGFTVFDYLKNHVVDLQARLLRESREHRALAKKISSSAAAAARARMPKSPEEVEEEFRASYLSNFRKFCLAEYKSILAHTINKVWDIKRMEYEEREAAAGRDRMKRMVDRSEDLLSARTSKRQSLPDGEASSNPNSDGDTSDSESVSDSDTANTDEDEGYDESDDETSADGVSEADPDEELTGEQLRHKYANLPDIPSDAEDHETDSAVENSSSPSPAHIELSGTSHLTDIDPALYELEEVDELLLEESEDDSSDNGTSATNSDEDDADGSNQSMEEETDEEEAGDPGLLFGFFSREERKRLEQESPDKPDTAQQDHDIDSESPHVQEATNYSKGPKEPANITEEGTKQQHPPLLPSASDEPSRQTTPNTNATSKASGPESMSSVEPASDRLSLLQHHAEAEDVDRMSVSGLIRGTLRPYQHAGFDWLARMYNESTNGILADEMGLGKTFQTIALLAHLATYHQVWGPHLVVVPTSVMLNWELEFKKFCPGFKILTYYGTQEERKQKRKGWMDKDKWHVCITSYQLALQDAAALKRRDWHYLILDEAHNIKNFRSQRWQTLLSFKSEARLLLTGTPLQNNLSELWSLLFFLAPEYDEDGNTGFGSLQEFSKVFHKPVDQILEHGRTVLDDESVEIVNKLHKVLRPHLLRRLKADVEKQMPKKFEHVTICRLSKRQRQLYDSYMSLAGTRESFASGNYMSIINCLMQLRKVCNHPDLFDTRQIVTSYAMSRSAVADFEIKDLLVRRELLGQSEDHGQFNGLLNLWQPNQTAFAAISSRTLSAAGELDKISSTVQIASTSPAHDYQTVESSLLSIDALSRSSRASRANSQKELTLRRTLCRPVYDSGILDLLTRSRPKLRLAISYHKIDKSDHAPMTAEPFLKSNMHLFKLTLPERAASLRPLVQRFSCITPAVIAPQMVRFALTDVGVNLVQALNDPSQTDAYHEARIRLSIAFPDKTLIQYDCGKLQQLDKLLRKLQSGGHRALIFTQMTKVLDILERFMNLHGHRYLRLDGATKIEQRQVLTDRFNSDPRILCFILSSRSGGLGINLTGADTVIFYDLDWNPAMDKQCQDRCHRIGQTRDVHIYRFVSEGTIEANILRKSNQKRMLDDVVIQEGDFTTDYLNRVDLDEGDADANAALDKVLGGGSGSSRVLLQAEDKEDQEAAAAAQKESNQTDAADFDERPGQTPQTLETSRAVKNLKDQPSPSATPLGHAAGRERVTSPNGAAAAMASGNALGSEALSAEQRRSLYEDFAAKPLQQDKPVANWQTDDEGNVITDADGNPAELPGFDEYLLRLVEWEMSNVIYLPPKGAKKGIKKGKRAGDWGKIRR